MNAEQLRLTLDAVYRPDAHGLPTNGNLANITDTAWGAYNAVAEWADWHVGTHRAITDERLLVRSVDDTTKYKARAFEMLAPAQPSARRAVVRFSPAGTQPGTCPGRSRAQTDLPLSLSGFS